MYTIGKLSKKTGVTIRTLDYYDQISLLSPKEMTEGGHRLYSDDDVMRLEQILALKYMSFPLDKIKQLLHETDWRTSVLEQLEMVRAEKRRLELLEQALEGVHYAVKYEKEVNWEVLFSIIHLFQGGRDGVVELLQPYLSTEEVNQIMDMKQAQDEDSQEKWEALLTDVRANLNKDPGSKEVQALALRWWKYVKEMFGADEGLIERMWTAMSSEKDHIMFYPMDKQVIVFMDKAIAVMHEREAVSNDN